MTTPRAGPVRIGVVGGGYWGPNLARNFADLPETDLVGIADRDETRRVRLRDRFLSARIVADHRDLLALDLDAVVVATPATTHYAIACEALAAGKHVLVEKPMVCSTEQSRELVRASEAVGRILMVGHTFEYNPAVELLQGLVAAGELGQLYYIHAARLNLGIFQQDINVLWDLAPHDLSILHFLLGETPVAVRAYGQAYVRPDIEDVAWMTLEFAGGVTAHIHVSWLDPCKTRKVTLVGDRKMAVYDDVASLDKVTLYDRGVDRPPYTDTYGEFQLSYRYGDVHAPRLHWEEPLKRECAHFARCVRTGEQPRSDGKSGHRVVTVLEAACASLRMGGARVSIDAAVASTASYPTSSDG